MKTLFCFLIISIPLISCAHNPSYIDRLEQRTWPVGKQAIADECSWIITEMYRVQALKERTVRTPSARASRAETSNNIAALQNRADAIQCNNAITAAPSVQTNNHLK